MISCVMDSSCLAAFSELCCSLSYSGLKRLLDSGVIAPKSTNLYITIIRVL